MSLTSMYAHVRFDLRETSADHSANSAFKGIRRFAEEILHFLNHIELIDRLLLISSPFLLSLFNLLEIRRAGALALKIYY